MRPHKNTRVQLLYRISFGAKSVRHTPSSGSTQAFHPAVQATLHRKAFVPESAPRITQTLIYIHTLAIASLLRLYVTQMMQTEHTWFVGHHDLYPAKLHPEQFSSTR